MILFRRLALLLLIVLQISVCLQAAQAAVHPAAAHPTAGHFALIPVAEQLQLLSPGDSPPAPVPADAAEPEPQEAFGAKVLNWAIATFDELYAKRRTFAVSFSVREDFEDWLTRQTRDTKLEARWETLAANLPLLVGMPLLAALAFEFVLLPARRNLRVRRPERFTSRLAAVLGLVGLKLLPVILFLGASLALLDRSDIDHVARVVVFNIVYALVLGRIVLALIRGLFAPRTQGLRLIAASTPQAVYAHHWLRNFSLVIIYGYFCVDTGRVLRVPETVITAFGDLLGLILVLMTLIVITQKRAFIAGVLRGRLAAQDDLSLFESLRLWFSRRWHVLATLYLVVGYCVTAFGAGNGFALMLRGTILTLLILVMLRLLFYVTGRWGAGDTTIAAATHHAILRFLLRTVIWVASAIAVMAAWGADILALFATPLGQRVLGAAFSIGLTITIVTLIYEGFSLGVERRISRRRDAEGRPLPPSARMRTLVPMIRNVVFAFFAVIVTLVALSEAGVNIGPLLAGAGVVGVAIGFGSQTLVKDFLTGFFIIVENTIAVGDRIKIGDYSGVIESISFRTVRLRDWDGALHILPFSEVTKITNLTKDFAFAQVNVGVAYDSDLERVMDVIREVGADLQKDPAFKRAILEPVEVQGVETLGDFSVTVASRIRVRPGKQWDVRRMFLLRLKQRFDKEGIAIPFPVVNYIEAKPDRKPPLKRGRTSA